MSTVAPTLEPSPLLGQLRALADPTRLKILALLREPGCCSLKDTRNDRQNGMCVCDLQVGLGLTQPTITHHLKVLRQAGLVECRKVGQWLHCCRNEEALDRVGAELKEI